MTGTSDEEEFNELYGFQTYRVRTRKRNIRIDEEDELYATTKDKYSHIIREVIECVRRGQPVLIGTTSLKESTIISALLNKHYIRHQLLNADNESEENEIIETAGLMGSVTVSTNMAGRGTDIKLGPGVKELGGLYVIGTSRNKSKRIDLQLRGRAGRQGDPGRSKYFMSLEDELVRENFGGKSIDSLISLYRGERIRAKHVINLVNRAQERRASIDKKIRLDNEKINIHYMRARDTMYTTRNSVLEADAHTFMTLVKDIISKYTHVLVDEYEIEDIERFIGHLVDVPTLYSRDKKQFKRNIATSLFDEFKRNFNLKDKTKLNEGVQAFVKQMKYKFLTILDDYWLDYVAGLDELRKTVSMGLEEDPFKKYEYESTDRFIKQMIPAIYNEMITYALNPTMKMGEYQIQYRQDNKGAIL